MKEVNKFIAHVVNNINLNAEEKIHDYCRPTELNEQFWNRLHHCWPTGCTSAGQQMSMSKGKVLFFRLAKGLH